MSKSSLAQELKQIEVLPVEFVDLIADHLASKGLVPKEQVTKVYGKGMREGFEQGKQTAAEVAKQVESLKQELETLRASDKTETRQGSSLKEESEFAKQIASLKGELTQLRNEQRATIEREKQRTITDAAKSVIAELGFDSPEAVLLLARREADFVFDPSDPTQLIVVKAGDPTQPIGGSFTNTTAREFFEQFANSPVGMKFRPVPQTARQGAGISGVQPTQAGNGPMSQQSLTKAWEKLGVS